MKKMLLITCAIFVPFWFKDAVAQVELAPPASKTKIVTVARDSTGWEKISGIGVRLESRSDKVLVGWQTSPISGRMILRDALVVADDSANGSLTGVSTTGGGSNFVGGKVGTGTFLPIKFWTNGFVRGTFATDGGFFMEGATGSSQGAGTINATGLYVNGVAVGGGGGSPSGWTDGTNVVYVTTLSDSVGIGLTAPVAKFHLHSRAYTQSSGLKITTPNTGTSIGDGFDGFYDALGNFYLTNRETGDVRMSANGGAILLDTDGTNRVYVSQNGEIFFGVSSYDGITAASDVLADGGIISITGSTNASTMEIRAVPSMYSGLFADRSSAGGTYLPMAFFTNGSERARILTTGAALFGFTSLDPDNSVAGQVFASGISATTSGVNGSLTGLFTSAGNYSGVFASRTSSGGTYLPMAFFTNGTQQMTLATNGGLFMAGATGGSQGSGTINAAGLYINGVAVSTGGGGGLTPPQVRAYTGWTRTGSTATDTTATNYYLVDKAMRFAVADADGDTVLIQPQALFPFAVKDGSTQLAGIDSSGRMVLGASASSGKLTINGDADETQLWIQGHSTQTDTLVKVSKSDGTAIFQIYNAGTFVFGDATTSSYASFPGGLLSEHLGASSQATGTESVALGYDARANTGAGNIAIGRSSRATNATGLSVAIGLNAASTGNSQTLVGYNSISSANGATFFGAGTTGNFASTVIGYGGVTTAAGQFIGGSTNMAATDVYFGNGISTTSTGTSFSIHGSPAASGQTNLAGGNVTINGGKGTGSGAGGDVVFQTATPGGSGTSQNAYVERMRIQDTGQIEHHNAVAMSIPSGATGPTEINSTGEVGIETNPLNGAFNFYNGSAEASLSPVITKTWVVTSPTSSENFGAVNFPFAVSVDSIVCVLRGSSTPSVTINFAHGLDRSSGTNLLTSGQAITSTTTGQRFGASSFSDATLAKGEFIWLTSSAQSGTVNELSVTMFLRKDAL